MSDTISFFTCCEGKGLLQKFFNFTDCCLKIIFFPIFGAIKMEKDAISLLVVEIIHS